MCATIIVDPLWKYTHIFADTLFSLSIYFMLGKTKNVCWFAVMLQYQHGTAVRLIPPHAHGKMQQITAYFVIGLAQDCFLGSRARARIP